MCGFAGVVAHDGAPLDRSALDRMGAVLSHRGPDDVGFHLTPDVGFVFRRLSILDTSECGHQPMASDDGNCVLVFNGEIYNFLELRQELEQLGWRFRSTGDTEVLLTAYRQWGPACVERFNGMWALLIHDRRRRVIFGSRDRMGVKPLYRYSNGTHTILASEIKAIRASGLYRGQLRWDKAAEFLLTGRADEVPDGRQSFYEGVEQVPPGSVFELSMDGEVAERRFWSIPAEGAGVPDPPQRFAALFEDAVRLRLRSDVPVGVSMSGGLDSTSVMCVMAACLANAGADIRRQPVRAFCYFSPDFDESRYIAATLEQTAAELHPVHIDPEQMWDGLQRFVWHHDEPVHSMTALVGYEVYRTAAAAGVKVVLGGQGADETVGGYPSYFRAFWRELARRGAWRQLVREIRAYAPAHGQVERELVQQALRSALGSLFRSIPAYHRASASRHARRLRTNGWFSADLKRQWSGPAEAEPAGSLHDVLQWGAERAPLPLYLRVEDRNSMAHSVEARLPFMDYRLVEFVFSLPSFWKIRGELNKFVLREAMRGRIPEVARTRVDKMGFPTSARRWFAGPLYARMRDLLASRAVRERGIYDVPAIERDLDRHAAGELDVSSALFNVAQVETIAGLDAGWAPAR